MGTQDFPLHLPNHETTLNAKPILTFASRVRSIVVKSATLECLQSSPQKALQYAIKRADPRSTPVRSEQ